MLPVLKEERKRKVGGRHRNDVPCIPKPSYVGLCRAERIHVMYGYMARISERTISQFSRGEEQIQICSRIFSIILFPLSQSILCDKINQRLGTCK